jgi:hypothetical protein
MAAVSGVSTSSYNRYQYSYPYPPVVPLTYYPPPPLERHVINNNNNNHNNNNNNSKMITLQVCKYKNVRGSFNTQLNTGVNGFASLSLLQSQVHGIVSNHFLGPYDMFYRYGQKGTKYQLTTNDHFDNINWADERLHINVTEQKHEAVGAKRTNLESSNGESSKPKKKPSMKKSMKKEQKQKQHYKLN